MLSRIGTIIKALLGAYGFYKSPVKFILSILSVAILPYLVYIFWGSLVVLVLAGFGVYFIFKLMVGAFDDA